MRIPTAGLGEEDLNNSCSSTHSELIGYLDLHLKATGFNALSPSLQHFQGAQHTQWRTQRAEN